MKTLRWGRAKSQEEDLLRVREGRSLRNGSTDDDDVPFLRTAAEAGDEADRGREIGKVSATKSRPIQNRKQPETAATPMKTGAETFPARSGGLRVEADEILHLPTEVARAEKLLIHPAATAGSTILRPTNRSWSKFSSGKPT